MAGTATSVNANNIELGEGSLFVKSPADTGYVDCGYTQGATLTYTPSVKDIKVGQASAPVKGVITGTDGSLKVKLVESSLRNFALAMGLDPTAVGTIGSSATSDYIQFGAVGSVVYLLGRYEVPQIDNKAKFYNIHLYKMRAMSGLALDFTAENERVFEVEFKLYADSANSYHLGKIEKER